MDQELSLKAANTIRILSAAMVEKAQSGHPGGAMGGADFIHILFSEFLQFDTTDSAWFFRDRFFLDPGHMSPMLYSVLTLTGHYSIDEIKNFRQWASPTPGHPELHVERGVENTSGPLGQGHTIAVGAAIAERFLAARFGEWTAHKTYTYISDGGIEEEVSQAAGRIAGHLGLSNLIMFYDANDVQLSTKTNVVTSEDTAMKYKAWGWNVLTIDGNNHAQIRKALKKALKQTEKPTLIIGKTIMGKGAVKEDNTRFEGEVETHGMPLSNAGASFAKTMKNLGADPDNPFVIPAEVAALYKKALKKKTRLARARNAEQRTWEENNADKAAALRDYMAGNIAAIDFAAIAHKPGIATRAASKNVLAILAKTVGNMVVSSADLSNSDNTDGFLANTTPFKKGDFSGAFLQAGVAELTMAAIMNGMALHGGIIPACGPFFTFSDYMKPAVRLAALMELPGKYIWTHDSFRVGEDGPTHQPVEHEAQLRLLEHMNNLSGKRSMLVLRPADAAETSVAWKMALENKTTPTALLLSRQAITDLPARPGSTRYTDACEAVRGAYIVQNTEGTPGLVLVANGSEVATLVEAAKIVASKKSVTIQIVSAPSEGLFREQDPAYQEKILPPAVPTFGLTAGLPVTLQGLVGVRGKVVGMTRFGASAPFKVLDEKFGFSPASVADKIIAFVNTSAH